MFGLREYRMDSGTPLLSGAAVAEGQYRPFRPLCNGSQAVCVGTLPPQVAAAVKAIARFPVEPLKLSSRNVARPQGTVRLAKLVTTEEEAGRR
jgi:hypothetical protein